MSRAEPTLRDVSVGDALPELEVPITTSLIVAGAIASRDFTPVHHVKEAAQAQGMSDVFMNILTTNGFVGRFVSDWAGVNGVIRRVSIKLGAPNLPGDTMRMTGEVVAIDRDEGSVEVRVTGSNSWGDHVTGSVCVALPAGS
ncbi:MAG: MaoC/PaaZ C-terminal domain-containing protein [Myxococcota bacterium]